MFDNKTAAVTAKPGLVAGPDRLPVALFAFLFRHMPGNPAGDLPDDLPRFSLDKLTGIGLMTALFLCLSLVALSRVEASPGARQESSRITARAMFAFLPPSIFENTSEGLSDDEFDALVEDGHTAYWRISRQSANDLVISAVSPVGSKVVLHLFRSNDGGVLATLGSQSGIVCALEFWRYDGTGKIIPVAGPEQPPINDLFLPGRLPAHVDPTIMMCLEQDKIFAKPVLWSANGIVHEPQDFIVHYFWNGGEFIKDRRAAHPPPSDPAAANQTVPRPDASPATQPTDNAGNSTAGY